MARSSRASARALPTKGKVTKDQLANFTDEMNKILFVIHDDAVQILPPNTGTDEEARIQATLPAVRQRIINACKIFEYQTRTKCELHDMIELFMRTFRGYLVPVYIYHIWQKEQVAEGKRSDVVLEPESPEQWHGLIPYMPIPFLEELMSDAKRECENFMNQ